MKINRDKERRLSFEKANELLRYDPETGKLIWRVDTKRRPAGDEAGSIAPTTGRPIITIRYTNYLQHRVIWLLAYGEWPSNIIDHVDGDSTNNRLENMREATAVQNGANRKSGPRRGPGSLKGASLAVRPNRTPVWRSSIRIEGKTKNLGSYKTELEAHQAYLVAARAAFGEFVRAA